MPDADYYMELPYHIKWEADFSKWTKEYRVAVLTCWLVEMPHVRGTGTDPDEALENLKACLRSTVSDLLADGQPVPYPLDDAAV